MRARILITSAAVLCLAACGTPGAPRPPSLRLPETVRDLAASRQGSTVTLTWTEPQRTTDGENIRALGPTLVCMGVNDFPMTHCDQMVADLTLKAYADCKPEIGKPASCQVTLAPDIQQQFPQGQATYAIEVLNTNGRSAGLSNQVRVPTAEAPPAARIISIAVDGDAVSIGFGTSIDAKSDDYHVFRSEQGQHEFIDLGTGTTITVIPPVGGRSTFMFKDRTFDWEKTYLYRVVGIKTVHLPDGSNADVKGDASADFKVFAHDVFPPVVPQGLQAVASGVGQQPFVDLTWAPNTDSDLAGYNVYRHEPGQPVVKVNTDLVKPPSFRDSNVQRGKAYSYSVSAVDLRGNESGRSVESSETVH